MIQPPTITMVDLKVNNYSFLYKKTKEPTLIHNHGLKQIEKIRIKSTNREPPVLFLQVSPKRKFRGNLRFFFFLSNRDKSIYYDSVL
jgi:hypothetical protein